MTELPDGWERQIERMAGSCAKRIRGYYPSLTYYPRYEAALSGIVEHVHEHGWPEDDHDLYLAGIGAIKREDRQNTKHLGYWSYWVPPPTCEDRIAEAVAERIGVNQLVWIFTDLEWEAVSAVAQTLGGGLQVAADLAGVSRVVLVQRLVKARRKARAAWIAAGETPRPFYTAGVSKRTNWHKYHYRSKSAA